MIVNDRSWLNSFVRKLQYFGDNCHLDGVRFVISRSYIHPFKRFFWLCVLTACVISSVLMLKASLGLYIEDAVSYSVETDYLHWETPFPAVTICEAKDKNNNPVDDYLIRNKLTNFSLNQKSFLKEVVLWQRNCKSMCRKCENCFKEFRSIVLLMRTECDGILSDCWWGSEQFRCCDRFLPQPSEYGVCFTFNSNFYGNETIATISRKSGLIRLVFTTLRTVTIKIHAPADILGKGLDTVLDKCETLSVPVNFEAILQVEQTLTDTTVKSISPDSRDCLFNYEIPVSMKKNWPFPMYSQSSCILYCRAISQFNYCGCIHHLMPDLDLPFCDIKGLICVSDLHEEISNVTCTCPMDCEHLGYKMIHETCLRNSKNTVTRGFVGLANLPTLRVRRQAIKDSMGFVVDIGGVIGVFFGASLFSIIEIVYMLCIRRQR